MFRCDLAADEVTHQHGNQGNGQNGGTCHGISLGECQWGKHPAFLGLQGKYRQKAQGDDNQREEQWRSDFSGCFGNRSPVILRVIIRLFHFLMNGFDHDNGGIDHGANCDGNTTQRHDVGVQALKAHYQESDDDAHR